MVWDNFNATERGLQAFISNLWVKLAGIPSLLRAAKHPVKNGIGVVGFASGVLAGSGIMADVTLAECRFYAQLAATLAVGGAHIGRR